MRNLTISTLATCLLATSSLPAAIVIEDGLANKPSVDFQTYGNWGVESTTRAGSKNNRDNTQSFTLDSAINVDKFVISVNDALAGASVTFRLFPVTGSTNASTLTLGSELVSEGYTFTTADATATAGIETDNLLTWDIPDLNLSAGGYALQIDGPASGPSGGVYVAWRADNDNPYAGGTLYRDGLAKAFNGTQDQTLGIVAVPEPSTFAMVFGLAALGLIALRRRR